MTNEGLLHIHLERDQEPQVHEELIGHHLLVPTVTVELVDTPLLNHMADAIRMTRGHSPCFVEREDQDTEGYYRFFVTLIGVWPGCKPYIEFTYVDDMGQETEDEAYRFYLDKDQRLAMFAAVNTLCDELWNETAVHMMAEFANDTGMYWKGMMHGDL